MFRNLAIGGIASIVLALCGGPLASPASADEYLRSFGAGSSTLRWDGGVSQTARAGDATIYVDRGERIHVSFTAIIDDQSIFYGASHYVTGTMYENGGQLASAWAARGTGGWETGRWWYTPEFTFRLYTPGWHQLTFKVDVKTNSKRKSSRPGTVWVYVY